MNPEDDFLLGPMGTPSTVGDFASDFARGVKFSPFDLLGAPVDLVNMGLQGVDTMFGRRNVLGSERPFLGADDLINRYADFVEYMGYDYGRPTNSPGEIAGRVTGGILAPTGGAATFGKAVDLLEAGGRAYAAGAPARVAERARTTTLGSGIDPTAIVDDMIVRRMGDNGGPPMTPEAPVRDIDDLGFYSQALETAKGLQQAKGTGQQYRSQLLKAGVKEDEIAFTPGLEGLLSQPRVTRDELVGLLEANRIRPYETIYAADDGPSFEGMNFPDTAEVLDIEAAYGRDYIDEEVNTILENDLSDVLYLLSRANPTDYPEASLPKIMQDVENEGFLPQSVRDDIIASAEEIVRTRYEYDPVLRLQDPDTGYEIVGSDDMGYTIRNEGGEYVDPGNNIPYSLSEARIQAETDAIDRGLIGYEGGGTRFEDNKEVGGSNYREIMLQVPNFEGKTREFVYSGHFDEPDIVVHARTTDRTTDTGQNVLYVEEMQSDWGQQGRQGGFANTEENKKGVERATAEIERLKNLRQKYSDESEEYVKNYQKSLGLGEDAKLTYADLQDLRRFDDKYEAIYQNFRDADREYDIERRVLERLKSVPEKGPFVGKSDKFAEVGIKRLLIKAVEEGKDYIQFSNGDVQDVRWNEEGLRTFYDRIIPKAASKVVKKLDPDASVGIEGLGTIENRAYRDDPGTRLTIEITPKMREAIKKGIPLFSAGGAGLLGLGMQDEPQPAGGIL